MSKPLSAEDHAYADKAILLSRKFGASCAAYIRANQDRNANEVIIEIAGALMAANAQINALISVTGGNPNYEKMMADQFLKGIEAAKLTPVSYALGDDFIAALSEAADAQDAKDGFDVPVFDLNKIGEDWN